MKYTINREENIPFREADGSIMQMSQYRIWVTVSNEEGETLEDIEKQADEILKRNIEKTLSTDIIYQRQKKQTNALAKYIKDNMTEAEARAIITKVKQIS